MKRNILKHILSLVIFVTVSVYVSGQVAMTRAVFPDAIQKTIVREYSYPSTVSYVETATAHYFAYADASMSVTCCEIDKALFVRDFTIIDDTVYFCGIDRTIGCVGLWGYFSVTDLASGSMHYSIYNSFACNKKQVDTLHAIAVYYESGTKHNVVVGTATDGSSIVNGCTIDITPSASAPSFWDYTIGVTSDNTNEDINHVCVTDNFVITAQSYGYWDMEFYRIHKRSSLFAPGGQQDAPWYFSYPSPIVGGRRIDKFALTHVENDVMAMAFQTEIPNYQSNNYKAILLYEYDMSTLSTSVVSTLYSLLVNIYSDTLEVEGLKYYKNSKDFVILLQGETPTSPLYGTGSVIATLHQGATNFSLQYAPNIVFQSLDKYNSQQNYLCLGYDNIQNSELLYYTQPLNISTVCVGDLLFQGTQPLFMTKQIQSPYMICSGTFGCADIQSPTALVIENTKECERQNTQRP
ncbi:MAG: hypothetical protein K5842_02245 [Bacteroidales bacterium]|nr:hypothetical protein [Bacteroidales bacterium]